MKENLLYERKADYQFYKIKGTHKEIGFETAKKGGKLIGATKLSNEQKRYALECRNIVREVYPEIILEFEGYANALSLQEEDLLWHYSLGAKGGCSSFAVMTDKGILSGRNYDYYYFENRRHLIHTEPTVGYSSIGMHEGLVGGRFDGMNEKGLFVSFNGAGGTPIKSKPGISVQLIVRLLLEKCKTAKEAKSVLLEIPIKEPNSYMIVDNEDAFVIEAHPERKEVINMENGYLLATNHFTHLNMRKYNKVNNHTFERYSKIASDLEELISKNPDMDNQYESIKNILVEHDPPICGHEDGFATFWSSISNLKDKKIYYCLGAPCRNKYAEYLKF
ncbi:C45 family autoproteolytic acyltransferase/hydolase [Cytobacillus oceanisediminis]|uniref:C45 family autoproteolytic acyltransferase/hydolase n=1 Tax=Cytobacillus oceanisediminis TaxID=665099 RepID=UPI001C228B82|nr:C45 family peptidase [Cytobacillus oceanisediminis]MBU8772082.1 C45 family peptidase [Cytobacillus oceanisediminis]